MNFMLILEKQWKLITGLFLLLVVGGLALVLISSRKFNQEQAAQEKYFIIEKKYIELKTKKNKPPEQAAEAKKSTPTKDEPVDFANSKNDFEKIISEFPGSKAAQMAAVYLSDILVSENNKAMALSTLQKVLNSDPGLVNTLVEQQIGLLLADQNKCDEALKVWQKIIDRKQASFLHNDVRIQQALCYSRLNDSKKAEEILTNLANQKPEAGNPETSASAKEAEKYLRLMQFKKASGT